MSSHDRGTPDRRNNHGQKHNRNNQNKRKRYDSEDRSQSRSHTQLGMGSTISHLRQPDLPEFNLTTSRPDSRSGEGEEDNDEEQGDWQTVENGRPRKKAKKLPKRDSANYPGITFSPKDSRLSGQIKISDLQNLALYILADGTSPQFVSVRHRAEIRKVVVLMVPGLEKSMFEQDVGHSNSTEQKSRSSPDSYYPEKLHQENLSPSLKGFADMFDLLWPVKTPGDDRFAKMHSPLQAMLTAPVSLSKKEKKASKNPNSTPHMKEPTGWKNKRTPVTEFIQTPEELLENDYVVHPATYENEDHKAALEETRQLSGNSKEDGWVDTLVKTYEEGIAPDNEIESGSLTAGREVLAMDCEMCKTGENEFSLTRISIMAWDGTTVLDELVKPDKPIIDYLTMYSGITKELLQDVTTTLQDIQKKLLEVLHPRTILIGHSLNSDLTALKLTHPYIIDTAIAYPHPRGAPLKSSLKWLAQRYLNREIQKGHGSTGPGAGHDSIEDARTCLDLIKQKCEKGKDWGASEVTGESIFKRVAKSGIKYKNQGGSAIPSPMDARSSAAVDWGDPKKGAGSAATYVIGCQNDDDVVKGVIRAVKGDDDGLEIPGGGADFVWGRLRHLEALKGWWNNNKLAPAGAVTQVDKIEVPTKIVPDTTEKAPSELEKDNAEPSANPVDDVALAAFIKSTKEAKGALVDGSTEPDATTQSDGEDILMKLDEQLTSAAPAQESQQVSPALTSRSNALPPPPPSSTPIETATATLTNQIAAIYDALPPCTAFIIYSGSGDPREMSRLQSMHTQFKREYKIKKWDQLSVKWTDTEEQALKKAVSAARNGIGFITVK